MVSTLQEFFKKLKVAKVVDLPDKQHEIDNLILNFVVNGMRPLSIVEDKDFIKLCQGTNKIIYWENLWMLRFLKDLVE